MYTLKKSISIALSSSDDKRLQIYDRITSCPYGTTAGRLNRVIK